MSKIRVPVEWSFGKIVNLFGFLDYSKKNKIYGQAVGADWQICTLLTNCHSCLYGNEVAKYFVVPTPDLEDYLG